MRMRGSRLIGGVEEMAVAGGAGGRRGCVNGKGVARGKSRLRMPGRTGNGACSGLPQVAGASAVFIPTSELVG